MMDNKNPMLYMSIHFCSVNLNQSYRACPGIQQVIDNPGFQIRKQRYPE